MGSFGFDILQALVNDIVPAAKGGLRTVNLASCALPDHWTVLYARAVDLLHIALGCFQTHTIDPQSAARCTLESAHSVQVLELNCTFRRLVLQQ